MNGLNFVITGVLDSLERDEAAELIKEHGGKVTTSLSKKTSYMVVGLEAGLKKLATADELKVRQISEDDLLDLIRKKSGLDKEADATKPTKKEAKLTPKRDTTILDVKSPKKEPKVSPKKEPISVPKKESTSSNSKQSPRKHNIKLEKPSTPPKLYKKEADFGNEKSIKTEPGAGAWHAKSQDIVTDREVTAHEKNIASVENQAWVDKYKPTSVKQIIGQQGASSNVAK